MDLNLRSAPMIGDVDFDTKQTTPLSLSGTVSMGDVTGMISLRRNRRGATLEIRPDVANLAHSRYEEQGKYRYHKPASWEPLNGGLLSIDNLPMARMEWGETSAYPGELGDGWTFATVPVLACNLTHVESDPLFAAFGQSSYQDLHDEDAEG